MAYIGALFHFWKDVFLHPKEFFEKADLDVDWKTTLKNTFIWSFTSTFGIQVLIMMLLALILFVAFLLSNMNYLTLSRFSYQNIEGHLYNIGFSIVVACVASLFLSAGSVLLLVINSGMMFFISSASSKASFSRLTRAVAICLPFIFFLICGLIPIDFLVLTFWSLTKNIVQNAVVFIVSISLILYSGYVIVQAIKAAIQDKNEKAMKIVILWFVLTAVIVFVFTLVVLAYVMFMSLAAGPHMGY
jgi:hypothetical protein